MWYLVRNDLMSIVEGKDNDSLSVCIQIGTFLHFRRALYHKHSVQAKWYSFWPYIWSWKEPQTYKPTIPDASSSLTSEPRIRNERKSELGHEKRNERETVLGHETETKLSWNSSMIPNNHESELEHQSETKANHILSMKMKRTSVGT